jgi:predicted metal-dependent hydrolase
MIDNDVEVTSDINNGYNGEMMKSGRMITNPEQASLDFGQSGQYRIRRSKRAKYLRINAHPDTGIEVVVPGRMSMRHVEPFIRQHQQWIDKQTRQLGLDQPVILPETIDLQMIGERWSVAYLQTAGKQYRLRQKKDSLIISGPDKATDACRTKLHLWLRRQAKHHLASRLQELSRQSGLNYGRLTVRTQRTRWGSCSSAGNINLNDRLLLLPAELVDYVMLHELCHTRHMNHSRQFWQLVERHVPQYRAIEKRLRQARQQLPGWI